MMNFKIPAEIVYSENAMEHLSTLQGSKATIVTGGNSMKKFGFLDKAKVQLEQGGFEVQIIDGVEPNPSVKTVIDGGKAMEEFNPDWIVALGGGSALDAAKVMWVFYEYPDSKFEDLVAFKFPKLRTKAKFVAIPSTSGTASEITAFSVITDTENHIKYPLVSPEMTPDIAIIDPELPSKMPPHITANTGMDVMTHAVEAYVSTAATCYTDPLAMKAIELTYDKLPTAYAKGDDMPARDDMHNASALAGIAFTNASLGLVHSTAHKIGGEFGITHGLANAILLPYIVEYNKKATGKYADIEKALGVDDLFTAIIKMNAELGIPSNLKDVDEIEISEAKFLEVLKRMSANAFADPCTLTNPRESSADEVASIYKAAFYGDKSILA